MNDDCFGLLIEKTRRERGLKLEVDRKVHANEIIFEQKR